MATIKWGLFSKVALNSIEDSNARLNIWEGAVRSSKTVCSIIRWLAYVKDGPEGDYLMIGKTERTLKRNILDIIEDIVGSSSFSLNRGLGELYIGGRRIYLCGASDERSEGKIRGLTLAGAYGDELTLWPESFWTMLLSRLSVPGAKLFGTTNSDSPYHYIKTNYLDRVDELDLKDFHFQLEDNLNLDPPYVESLKREYVGLWYKRFILGLWVLAEGAIYDMWDDDENLFENCDIPVTLQQKGLRTIAIDYGTTNPMAFLDIYDDGTNLWQMNEFYYDSSKAGYQMTDGQYADKLVEFIKGGPDPGYIILDPSAASFRAELRTRGFVIKEADNEVLDGIRVTAAAIKNRIYRVHKTNCPNTRKELAGYVWDDKAKLRGVEQPLKTSDHAMDAMRYYCKTMLRPWRLTKLIVNIN